MDDDKEKVEVYRCDLCGTSEFDSLQKLSVHKTHCRKKTGREERIPFGVPMKRFNAPEDDRFVYRVFNDKWRKEPGRLKRAQMAGYELAEHDRSGDAVGTNEDGSEIKGVLMKIPRELYEEDQAAKQREIDKVDEQIMGGNLVQVDKKYTPDGGIKKTVYR